MTFVDPNSAGVVVVNWNGWKDTIECLEAVFRMEHFSGVVVVCDNGSVDGSLENIEAWARGDLCAVPESHSAALRSLVLPPMNKPLDTIRIDPRNLTLPISVIKSNVRLFLVDLGENCGFAAANNVGLRLLSSIDRIDTFWLLNNDALPARDAYRELALLMATTGGALICGSTLIEYWEPEKIQACGASYNVFFGRSKHLLEGQAISELKKLGSSVAVDYPVGASLAVNRAFLGRYGAMSEDYFLYFEEIDWVVRKGWPRNALVSTSSLVFHKGGKSTLAGRDPGKRSLLADYYLIRGRLLFARKYSWLSFILTIFVSLLAVLRRVNRPAPGGVINAFWAFMDGCCRFSRSPFAQNPQREKWLRLP